MSPGLTSSVALAVIGLDLSIVDAVTFSVAIFAFVWCH